MMHHESRGQAKRVLALFFWLFAFIASPALAEAPPQLRPLEQQLAAMNLTGSGDVGIAALDLRSGELVSVKGNVPFPMASTVKIAIAANYLAQVENGRRSLDDKIRGQSAARLMEAMIIHSDNHATDVLLRDLGGPGLVQQWLAQNNVKGLRIDRNIADLLRSKRDLYDVRDSSTPTAMVELLKKIDDGSMLQPSSRSYLLGLMARCQTGKNRIRGLLPSGTFVQNKTGTLSGLTTDVGFMTLPDGRRLAVAFFARHGSNRPGTIAVAARAVYDGFTRMVRGALTPGYGYFRTANE
jgi:beta-lactamase class A